MATVFSESRIWQQIEDAEHFLLGGMFEDAAALANTTVQCVYMGELVLDDDQFLQVMKDAGFILVQSLQKLGRTGEIFVELQKAYASLAAAPFPVILMGASMQIVEGFGSDLRAIMEDYLAKWKFADTEQYILMDMAVNDSSSSPVKRYFISAEEYMEMVELYAVTLLGLVLHDVDGAISWMDQADLPEEERQDLIERLRILQSAAKPVSHAKEIKNHSPDIIPGADSAEASPAATESNFSLDLRHRTQEHPTFWIEPRFWWFHSIKVRFGKFHVVIPSGKLILFFSLLLSTSLVLRKRGWLIKRFASAQWTSLRRAVVDAWKLAFSTQINPLAAVQQLPSASRVIR